MKPMTPRQTKVAKEVQHLCAMALVQGRIPSTLPTARLTVVDCWVSPDLRLARLYLQLPEGANGAEMLATANAQLAKPLRKWLAENLSLKNIPQITLFPAEDDGLAPQ